MRRSNVETAWWCGALLCFTAFALVGTYVSGRTPTRIDVEAVALRGTLLPLAEFFTALGRWWVIAPVAVAAALVAGALRAQPAAIGILVASQMISQGVVAAVKGAFHRTRPDYWLVHQEKDLSFPSGHAVTTIVFYLGLALLVWRTPSLPRPAAMTILAVLAIVIAGIPWSRIALGAHYLTDVIGGLLFGAGWMCATLAILSRTAAVRSVSP